MRDKPIDPAIWRRTDVLAVLADRDVQGIYRALQRHGVSQRRIAAMTGQSQSEISEIIAGRQVTSYSVLVRIADGLGIPRGHMGLAHDELTASEADETVLLPRIDSGSGRWIVRLPVYFDSYSAALGLCESFTAASSNKDEAPLPPDDFVARRWQKSALAVLAAPGGLSKRAS